MTNSYWIDPAGIAPLSPPTLSAGSVLTAPIQVLNGINEAEVFFRELGHTDAEIRRRWTLRIGTGGQIYSIRTSLGELIGAQGAGSEWMDRVFQTVAVDSTANAGKNDAGVQLNYFIQQGGAYPDKGALTPYYSPSLGSSFDQTKGMFRTMSWPQQSQPDVDQSVTALQSNYLLQQNIRDLGMGAVEITWIYTNFGSATCDFIDLPWSGFKRSAVPRYVISHRNAGWTWAANPDASWGENAYNLADTYGWAGLVDGTSTGLSVVFAKPGPVPTPCGGLLPGCPAGETCAPGGCAPSAAVAACTPATPYCSTSSIVAGSCVEGACRPGLGFLRFGHNGPSEDLIVFEALPSRSHVLDPTVPAAQLSPMKSYFYRVFMVFGELGADLHPLSNFLATAVSQGELRFPVADAGLMRVCDQAAAAASLLPCAFYTFDRPVENARPLLLLRDTVSGRFLYSTSPYALSFRPASHRTEYVALVGWVVPRTQPLPPDPRWVALSTLLGATSFPDPTSGRGDAWVVSVP